MVVVHKIRFRNTEYGLLAEIVRGPVLGEWEPDKEELMRKIELGDTAKDTITGLTGIVVAITEWLHSCRRITIQPQHLNKDGQPLDNYTIDEPQAELIEFESDLRKRIDNGKKPGGPSISPVSHGGPM